MAERALLALMALLVNAALGGPRSLYMKLGVVELAARPVAWMRLAQRRLDREHRSEHDRQARGLVVLVWVALIGFIAGLLCDKLLAGNLHFIEIILLAALLPARGAWDVASQVRASLLSGDLAPARAAFAGTAVRHQALLDEYGLARSALELLAVTASEKILAPLFWYLLLGLPGFFICLGVTQFHEATGAAHAARGGFAEPVRAAHVWLHWLPARLALLFWVLAAALLPAGRAGRLLERLSQGLAGRGGAHGALLGFAEACGVSLGGPASAYAPGDWLEGGTARPLPADLRRGQVLFAFFGLFTLLMLGLLL